MGKYKSVQKYPSIQSIWPIRTNSFDNLLPVLFSSRGIWAIFFSNQCNSKIIQETIMVFIGKMFRKVPAAYVLSVLGFFHHFSYSCSNGSEIFQLRSLHIVNHKRYQTTNKLNICHYNLNGNLYCIFAWFGKVQRCVFR